MNDERKDELFSDIINEILKTAKQSRDLLFFENKKMLRDLIIELDKNKDRASLINSSLVALVQHCFILEKAIDNLKEATELLNDNNIPFDSILVDDKE